MIWWEEELEKHFLDNKIDDLSDFDVTWDKTFYIAINGFSGDFGSDEFDEFSEHDHVYYMVVNISGDGDMAYLDFLKYAKGSKGRNLVVSEEPFLEEHEKFKKAGINFIMGKGLTLHNYDKALESSEKSVHSSEIHYAGDYHIRYRVLNKKDENNPDILDRLQEIFSQYEKQIGIDLQFQDFQTELANLPGDYAGPKGAIILAEVIETDCVADLPGIAGCVALRPFNNNTICEMKRLFVKPQYKGLEIGRELARRIIIEARKRNYNYMRLDTLSTMEKAQKLYESLGFYDMELKL